MKTAALVGITGSDWPSHLAWSNLYRVSPHAGGNPGHAAWRTEIVPTPDPDRTPEHLHLRLTKAPTPSPSPSWIPWAALLWRVFEKGGVACPRCGLPMRLRTVVLPPATLAALAGLDAAAARAPPLVA